MLLEVRLLGQFELRVDGEERALPSRPAQSLLAYLLLHAGMPQRRERLAGLLWPDHSEESARRNLRTALWRVRKVLSTNERGATDYIISDSITATFNARGEYWLDTAAFALAAQSDLPSAELGRRISLYRGELLPGFFDEWIRPERERFEALFHVAMQRLLDGYLKEGRWDEAEAAALRWTAAGQAPEPAYRALMVARAGLGDLLGVAQAFDRCRSELTEELGVEPSAPTLALRKSLMAGVDPMRLLPDTTNGGGIRTRPAPGAEAGDAPAPGEPPYCGLRHFREEDAPMFFGREALSDALLARLQVDPSLLVIVGASGSGKSSLVRAGIVPRMNAALEIEGRVPTWQMSIATPSTRPLEALALSLTRSAPLAREAVDLIKAMREDAAALSRAIQKLASGPRGRLLLVVDQFEEVFTLCQSEEDRRAFIENLFVAVNRGSALTLITSVRADFYAHCARYPLLRDALASHQAYIGPLSAEEMRLAVEGPARQANWRLEPGLVDLVLRDTGDEPGSLPLLSHALLETWKRRRGRTLTVAGYLAAGGVREAIGHSAERVYRSLRPAEQAVAQNAFLRMTAPGEGTQDTRRRVGLGELVPAPELAPLTHDVLAALAGARLVTISDMGVEVAHEALIREWPRLRAWLDEDREGLRIHRKLTAAAVEWESLAREPSALYRGAILDQAVAWAGSREDQINQLERDFLEAAREQAAREDAERAAQRERELEAARQLALAADAATAAREQAEQQRRLATARELAAAAITSLATDPERSILLAIEAINATYLTDEICVPEAETALHQALVRSRVRLTLRPPEGGPVWAVRYRPDGGQLATAESSCVTFWDTLTGDRLSTFKAGEAQIGCLAYSPDGTRIATAGDETLIRVWDVSNIAFPRLAQTLRGNASWVARVLFHPSGHMLASVGADRRIVLWDLVTESVRCEFLTAQSEAPPIALAFSPDGERLAGGGPERSAKIWDIATGRELAVFGGHSDIVATTCFSPDGRRLVSTSLRYVAKIWDVDSTELLASLSNHANLMSAAVFSPDGSRVLTGSYDGTARVWDAETGREMVVLAGHERPVTDAVFSPDGLEIATSGEDGTARVWSVQPPMELACLQGPAGDAYCIAMSPDGDRLAVAYDDGAVRVWDVGSGREAMVLPAGPGGEPQFSVAFSPDGLRLATAGQDAVARVWDASTGELLILCPGHGGPVRPDEWLYTGIQKVTFSPDGSLLATAGADGTARVWDASTSEQLLVFDRHGRRLNSVRFSPDGRRLASAGDDEVARVWDLATGHEIGIFCGHPGRAWAAEFSPDGRWLATSGRDALIRVWDLASGQALQTLAGHTSTVNSLAFSPDGGRLASAGDSTARVWDLTSGREVLTLHVDNAAVRSPVFGPEGKHLAICDGSGAARVYTLQLDELIRLARGRVTRALTDAERRKYLHLEPSHPAGPA